MIYGVGEASKYYFGKSVSELTLPEAAMLAGMYQAPSRYNPYTNPEAATARRTTVLKLMKLHGYITEEERLMAENVSIESMLVGTSSKADYQGYIDTVIEEVENKTGNNPAVVSMKIYTAMDREAAKRGTTVYLVDKRIDMLPALLGTNLCSLRSNVDRLAFSCIWELTPEAEIVNVHFTKSVIRSKASLSYEEAQDRNDDERMNDNITKSIRILNGLAKKLKKKRIDSGALTLASPEVRFNLENDSQDPVDVEMKELKETNALVEEFMLLANISVAKKIHSKYPESSLLRRHPTPPQSNFDVLIAAAESVGIHLNCSSSKELADSLDKAIIPGQPYFNKLIRIMTTRCMMQAVYFSSGTVTEKDYWHYGLATEIYTHFTSPIRRYSDVIVHRLLAAAIDYGEGYSTDIIDKMKIQKICDVLNFRHRMAQQASRSSVELFTNLYFKDRIVEEEGFIIRILKNGFVVLIPRYGIESIIYSEPNNKSGSAKQIFTYDAKENKLVSEYATLKVFDKITVQISIEEVGVAGISSKLSMKLVKPIVPGISIESQNIKMDDKQLSEIDDEIKNRIEIIKEEENEIQSSIEPSSKKRRVAWIYLILF